jgi:hypothetical protein
MEESSIFDPPNLHNRMKFLRIHAGRRSPEEVAPATSMLYVDQSFGSHRALGHMKTTAGSVRSSDTEESHEAKRLLTLVWHRPQMIHLEVVIHFPRKIPQEHPKAGYQAPWAQKGHGD